MAFQIQSVLISDDIDCVCPKFLSDNGINVTQKSKLSTDQLKTELKGHDALIVRSATKVTKEILESSPGLKLVGRAGTGVDNIDVTEATKRGIIVMNTPAGNSRSAAELTCSMILNLSRKVPQAHQSMKEGRWDRKLFMGSEVSGKTLAVIGLGRIGRDAASRMQAFGMRTIGYDPLVSSTESQEFGVEWMTLEEIWPIADYITVHVPLIRQTKDLINSEVFAKTKRGVFLINCARGGIISEEDLVLALDSGACGGAALDVYSQEPPVEKVLINHPNVICTPHLGASTKEAQFRVAEEIAQQIVALNQGKTLGAINAGPLAAGLDPSKLPWIRAVEDLSRTLLALSKTSGLPQIKNLILAFPQECRGMESALKAAAIVGLHGNSKASGVNLINADSYAKDRDITVSTVKHTENGLKLGVDDTISVSGVPSFLRGGTVIDGIMSNEFKTGILCKGTIVLAKHEGRKCMSDLMNYASLSEKFLAASRSNKGTDGDFWMAHSFDSLTDEERKNNFIADKVFVEF